MTTLIWAGMAAMVVTAVTAPATARQNAPISVVFDSDSDALTAQARAQIATFARDHKAAVDDSVRVQGHATLAESYENSSEYAVGLAHRRAGNVRSALVEEGVRPGAIVISAYGASRALQNVPAASDAGARQSGSGAMASVNQELAGWDRLDHIVYFDVASAEVRPYAEPRLNAQARWLLDHPSVAIRIEGNTDVRGSREYNFALGARRAEAVRVYLIRQGVASDRIDIVSFGEVQPSAEGLSEDALALNRNTYTNIMPNAPR